MMRKKLVCLVESGIADRIRWIMSCATIAAACNRELLIEWLENDQCGASFSDLFESKNLLFATKDQFIGLPITRYYEQSFNEIAGKICASSEHVIRCHAYAGLPFWYDWTSLIRFSPSVCLESQLFSQMNFKPNMIGVHVRDGGPNYKPHAHNEYLEPILSLNLSRKIFVAHDCPAVAEPLLNALGTRAVCYPSRARDRSKEGCFDGIVELSLLRQCTTLVVTGNSGFSKLAWRTAPSFDSVYSVDNQM